LIRLTRLLLFVLVALALLTPAGVARAGQQNPVTLTVRAGYDGNGQYHVGHWFPVSLLVGNDGGDLRASLEWSFAGDTTPSFRYSVDLPRGAHKQLYMPVVSSSSERVAHLNLLVDGKPVLSSTVRLTPIDTNEVLVGVLSSDQTLLNSLSTAQLANGSTTALSRLSADLLPTDAMLLEGLDVIVIHDVDTAAFPPGQRDALERWVRLGGELLVGGGPNAGRTAAGLGTILPVQVEADLRTGVSVEPLERLAGRSRLSDLVQSISANQVTRRPGAISLDGQDLIVVGAVGAGQVIFAAFDLSLLRAWRSEPSLWQPILALEDRMQLAYSLRVRGENIVRGALQLAALKLPSPVILLLLIGVYILVIGPLNFLLLRRLRRLDLAWVTTPVLVAIFLLGAYGVSFVLRGTRPVVAQLAFVQANEGQTGGQASAFVSVFSPQRRSYSLSFGPDALLTPGAFDNFMFNTVPVDLSDSAVQLPDLLVDVSSLRTLLVEQTLPTVPTVQSRLSRSSARMTGSLVNASGETLYDAMIVSGDAAQPLGDLSAGSSIEVNFARNMQSFPPQFTGESSELFNQEQVLMTLFSFDRFALGGSTFTGQQGLPERDAVYLLAWRKAPALEVALDGDSQIQQGMTLYLIRLNI
jgi:hypothetical protein